VLANIPRINSATEILLCLRSLRILLAFSVIEIKTNIRAVNIISLAELIAGRIMYEFDTIIMEDETGGYVAFVPALPGCHTQGDTLQELLDNVKEAIELYLETLTEEEKKELLRQKVVGIQKVKALA